MLSFPCFTKMRCAVRRLACFFFILLSSALLAFSFAGRGHAYVLPYEQLIGFMAANFAKFETIVIRQFTEVENPGDAEKPAAFEEIVTMKAPNLFRTELVGSSAEQTREIDHRYRELLIASGEQGLTELLSGMGIDMEKVSFTRIDGLIAYMIGDRDPDSPKILIEKERFLPLLLIYGFSTYYGQDVVRVRFKDYRQVEQGWYPFEITYSAGGQVTERYIIQSLRANVPVSPSYFSSPSSLSQPEAPAEEGGSLSEEERLRRIIETFEQKYGR